MDSIPIFLQIIKSNTLIYSIIMTGNLSLIRDNYAGKYDFASPNYVTLNNFVLTDDDFFEEICIRKSETGIDVSFKSLDTKYFTKHTYYFGEKTIYSPFEKAIEAKGIVIKHPLSYQFNEFMPVVNVTLMDAPNSYGQSIYLDFKTYSRNDR
jgi:hypothetical protein